jgi:hypothetical protein
VEIHYDDRRLRVRVRDDGKGIDPELLSSDGRKGHYGLSGMRERAQLIGGQLTVWSELESGTEVDLSVPAERAYKKRPWLAEKFLAKLSRRDTVKKTMSLVLRQNDERLWEADLATFRRKMADSE